MIHNRGGKAPRGGQSPRDLAPGSIDLDYSSICTSWQVTEKDTISRTNAINPSLGHTHAARGQKVLLCDVHQRWSSSRGTEQPPMEEILPSTMNLGGGNNPQCALTLANNVAPKPGFLSSCERDLAGTSVANLLPLGTVRGGALGHGAVAHTCALERQRGSMNIACCHIVRSKKENWTFAG